MTSGERRRELIKLIKEAQGSRRELGPDWWIYEQKEKRRKQRGELADRIEALFERHQEEAETIDLMERIKASIERAETEGATS